MAENTNPFAPYANYDEYLATMTNKFYGIVNQKDLAKTPATDVREAATDIAKTKLKSNRRRTALIIAGLALGTILTGGALGLAIGGAGILGGTLAGLGSVAGINAGIGVGATILGVSGASLGLKWKMVYNTLNPWATRDPDVLMSRALVHNDRWDRRLQRLEQQMDAAKTPEQRRRLQKTYARKKQASEKFLNKYMKRAVYNTVRLDCQDLQRNRPGMMGKFDKTRTKLRDFSANTLGMNYFENKYAQRVEKGQTLLSTIQGMVNNDSIRGMRYGVPQNEQYRKDFDKIQDQANYWFRLAKGDTVQKLDTFGGEKLESDRDYNYSENVWKQDLSNVYVNGKPLNLDELKENVNGLAKDKGLTFERNSSAFINTALEKGNFSNNQEDIQQNIDVVKYLMETGTYNELSPKAKSKIASMMNKNSDIQMGVSEMFTKLDKASIPSERDKITETYRQMMEDQDKEIKMAGINAAKFEKAKNSNPSDDKTILKALQTLNPDVDLSLNMKPVNEVRHTIVTSEHASKLILPNGFYYNDKNGITNKHNTQSGLYIKFRVENPKTETKQAKQDAPKQRVVQEVKNAEPAPKKSQGTASKASSKSETVTAEKQEDKTEKKAETKKAETKTESSKEKAVSKKAEEKLFSEKQLQKSFGELEKEAKNSDNFDKQNFAEDFSVAQTYGEELLNGKRLSKLTEKNKKELGEYFSGNPEVLNIMNSLIDGYCASSSEKEAESLKTEIGKWNQTFGAETAQKGGEKTASVTGVKADKGKSNDGGMTH